MSYTLLHTLISTHSPASYWIERLIPPVKLYSVLSACLAICVSQARREAHCQITSILMKQNAKAHFIQSGRSVIWGGEHFANPFPYSWKNPAQRKSKVQSKEVCLLLFYLMSQACSPLIQVVNSCWWAAMLRDLSRPFSSSPICRFCDPLWHVSQCEPLWLLWNMWTSP